MSRLWGVHRNGEKMKRLLLIYSHHPNPHVALLAQAQLAITEQHLDELCELAKEIYGEGID
jgi:hypothetical protein